MKFDCGETREEYEERIKQWHSWFAWYPVWAGSHDCRWLETIERRSIYELSGYDVIRLNFYRAKKN